MKRTVSIFAVVNHLRLPRCRWQNRRNH